MKSNAEEEKCAAEGCNLPKHHYVSPRHLFPQDYWDPRCACGNEWPCKDLESKEPTE